MKRLMLLSLLVALALPALGCFHNQIVMSPDYDPAVDLADHEELRLHLLNLVPLNDPVNLNRVCPNGAGVVESRVLFGIRIVTFSQARVYCNTTSVSNDEKSTDAMVSADF